ncbi:MAG TPA: glycosyltransferase family 39 protein [Coleofasciculaceae cyanobacterium]|jgi:uncharacterized membrane protein
MAKYASTTTVLFPSLIVVLLLLGIFFRFANLDYKVYWHDEVYTSIRAAGFTRQEIDQELFQNRIVAAQELQKFQRIKPGSTANDTLNSLAVEDPQHPPLYFLMARFWMQMFGSSLTASRSLPALLSLLGLPLMYGLGLELFGSRFVALLATVLLALSPFDVLFAQTARQYSLLTVAVICSSFSLLRAVRCSLREPPQASPTWQNWVLYSLGSALGLYTQPIFGLTLIAQGVYVLLLSLPFGSPKPETQRLVTWWRQSYLFWQYLLAVLGAFILYSPWLVVIKTHYQRFSDTTDWTTLLVGLLYLVKLWILSFTCLFFDLEVGFDNVWTYLLRLPVVLLIAAAIYTVCRQTNRKTWLFILTTIFVPFLMLALPDVLYGGKRSAVTRYLISCYPGVQLAVAYLLAHKLLVGQLFWRGVMALLLTGSIASCTVRTFSNTWWDKDLSYFNMEVAKIINTDGTRGDLRFAAPHLSAALATLGASAYANTAALRDRTNYPLVLSDIGDDFTNTGDLISLSYELDENVRLLLLSKPPNLAPLQSYSEPLVFRPSKQVCKALKDEKSYLDKAFAPGQLWRVRHNGSESGRLNNNSRLSC